MAYCPAGTSSTVALWTRGWFYCDCYIIYLKLFFFLVGEDEIWGCYCWRNLKYHGCSSGLQASFLWICMAFTLYQWVSSCRISVLVSSREKCKSYGLLTAVWVIRRSLLVWMFPKHRSLQMCLGAYVEYCAWGLLSGPLYCDLWGIFRFDCQREVVCSSALSNSSVFGHQLKFRWTLILVRVITLSIQMLPIFAVIYWKSSCSQKFFCMTVKSPLRVKCLHYQ